MGLDFSHGGAHWSYSGFHYFRERLADSIGIHLRAMKGFRGRDYSTGLNIGGTIPWDAVHDDIAPLLNHSDCDGELTPEECAKVAPRLRELVSRWPDEDYDKEHALRLVAGMEECVREGVPLKFW